VTTPYYTRASTDLDGVFDATNDGYIAPDGNPEWIAYLGWLEAGNTPDERPDPTEEIAARRAQGISKLIALGLTEDEARAIAGT